MCSSAREGGAPFGTATASTPTGVAARRWFAVVVATEAVLVALGSFAFDTVFHNPYCGLLFRCNCTWNWAGGWDGCNVHRPTGPRCPFCAAGNPPTPGFNDTGNTLSRWVGFVSDYLVTFCMWLAWVGLLYGQVRHISGLRGNPYFHRRVCPGRASGGPNTHQRGGAANNRCGSICCCCHDRQHRGKRLARTRVTLASSSSAFGGGAGGDNEVLDVARLQDRGAVTAADDSERSSGSGSDDGGAGSSSTGGGGGASLRWHQGRRKCRRAGLFVWRAVVAPSATFLVYNFVAALAFFLASDYPYFLWWNATARVCGGIDFPCPLSDAGAVLSQPPPPAAATE